MRASSAATSIAAATGAYPSITNQRSLSASPPIPRAMALRSNFLFIFPVPPLIVDRRGAAKDFIDLDRLILKSSRWNWPEGC